MTCLDIPYIQVVPQTDNEILFYLQHRGRSLTHCYSIRQLQLHIYQVSSLALAWLLRSLPGSNSAPEGMGFVVAAMVNFN